jgi:GNAT superfamily N-acetyltransferase
MALRLWSKPRCAAGKCAVRALTSLHGSSTGGILLNVDPQIVRYSERPELWDTLGDLFRGVWPEYNQHGDELNYYWRQLYDVFPEWQFLLVDPDQTVLAEGHTVPVTWDGTDDGLGPGIDATIAGAFRLRAAGRRPTALSAMAAEVPPRHQGRGLAPVMLRAMAALTRGAGLEHLIAPVRPSHKDRYPTIPIERYARWARDDGTPFDPWVRVHVRMGARIGPVVPRSLHITGTVADWESWTRMRFPETGDYVFPAGLATVHIDREKDTGEYWEPNIWIIHQVSPQAGC